MTAVLGSIATILVPVLIALGSLSRRRLSLIRAETAALKEIPADHPAHRSMSVALEHSADAYARAKYLGAREWVRNTFRVLLLVVAVAMVVLALTVFDYFVDTGLFASDDVRATVRLICICIVLGSVAFAALITGLVSESKTWTEVLDRARNDAEQRVSEVQNSTAVDEHASSPSAQESGKVDDTSV